MEIKYVSVTANGVVFTGGKHIVGWESDRQATYSFYDEASSSKTAAQLCDTLRGTAYYKRAHNVFPLPGVKLNNGLYIYNEDATFGTVTVYYHEDYNVSGSILYCPISEANVSLSSAACELIGVDVWSGSILVYDGTSAIAGQLVSTVKTGSYFFYGSTMFSEPIDCDNGLYIVGTGGKGEIFYRVK
jgi:hypothetical protein